MKTPTASMFIGALIGGCLCNILSIVSAMFGAAIGYRVWSDMTGLTLEAVVRIIRGTP